MTDVLERFMRYVRVDSASDPDNASVTPSTARQHDMARLLADELAELGCEGVSADGHAYVTGALPASPGAEGLPALVLCAHIDSSPDAPAEGVSPHVVRYEGGELAIGAGRDGRPVTLSPDVNPELERMVGGELVVTDGTSLLGGDDKAGVAECVALLARLRENPELPHPRLALAFVPDEEIGHGAALLDLEAFGADFGYTIDGGPLGEFCYETFNAAEAELTAHGVSVHTGTAKGKMVNASEAIMRFHQLLPAAERPEFTEGYDGFFYLERMEGSCEEASAAYIIRDHDQAQVERRKDLMRAAAALVNAQMGEGTLELAIHDQYHNLADVVCRPENAHLIDNARAAYAACGVEMTCVPMRGGTDGSQLSFRGFPCANLSAGYYNAHGVREFVPVAELERMVDVLQDLVGRYARPQA